MTGARRFAFVVALLGGGGCRNACQDICTSMADYAVECGYTVSDTDLDACYARHGNPEKEDAKACRDFGDAASLRRQWTCEDVGLYFGGGATS